MNCSLVAKALVFAITAAFLFSACGITGGEFGIRWGEGGKDVRVAKGVGKKSPPPHARAHGYRAKYQYRYYPSCSVYFDTEREIYFYLSGENWQVSASLPSDLSVQLGGYVSIEMDNDRPYVYHKEHKAKYPPGQSKKKRNKWVKQK